MKCVKSIQFINGVWVLALTFNENEKSPLRKHFFSILFLYYLYICYRENSHGMHPQCTRCHLFQRLLCQSRKWETFNEGCRLIWWQKFIYSKISLIDLCFIYWNTYIRNRHTLLVLCAFNPFFFIPLFANRDVNVINIRRNEKYSKIKLMEFIPNYIFRSIYYVSVHFYLLFSSLSLEGNSYFT